MARTITLIVFAAVLAGSFTGCARSLDPQIDFKAPEYVQQMPSREDEQSTTLGSLFGQGDNPLFADRKAMNINDIVTVLIEEQTSSTSSANRQLNKTQNSNFSPAALNYAGKSKNAQKVADRINGAVGFGLSSGSESAFNGGGTASRTENFTTTVSARIVKVMQNGNYFIEGRREILVEDEKQIIQISGVIRPYDITQTNTISSAYISDAKISYHTEGDIKRNTQQGWGTRLVNSVWPF